MEKGKKGSSHPVALKKRDLDFHPDRIMVDADEYREAVDWIDNQVVYGSGEEDRTFLPWFESLAKQTLRAAGFKRETLEDKEKLGKSINLLRFQRRISVDCGRIPPQNGFPTGTFTISEDNLTFQIDIQVEAALRTLETIEALRQLLADGGVVNREAMKVYLLSIELMINQLNTGHLGGLAARQLEIPEKGKEGGKKSGMIRGERANRTKKAWQTEADKIWERHPGWGKLEVGKRIAEKIGGKAGTIRKSIKKLLP